MPVSRLAFTPFARRLLQRQLSLPGRLRGGLLFGRVVGTEVEVQLVSSLGSRWWLTPELGPLHLEAEYVLGWSDALEAEHGGQMDWVGHWIAQPDNRLPDLQADLNWLDQAARAGLVDSLHPLMVAGWEDGSLHTRAYAHDNGEVVTWACEFRP